MWIRFYLPALFYFIIVALTGSLLRYQWTVPEHTLFNAQYLIHAHSHVAILGWLFLVLCGFLLEYGMQKRALEKSKRTIFSILVQITVIGMLISFALEGYALASITFSTLHILLSYYFAVIYFRYERMDLNPVVRNFYNAAIFWMILSSFGPWLLAAGSGLTPFWLDTSIGFYLHLQFNGWFVFFLAGFAYHFLINRYYKSSPKWGSWPFTLMFLGLLPSLVPIIDTTELQPWLIMAGILGTIVFSVGSFMVLWLVWQSRSLISGYESNALFWFAFLAGIAKTGMQAATAVPSVVTIFLNNHYVVVGFIHLLLLGFISTALLYIFVLKFRSALTSYTWHAGSALYQSGIFGMLLILFGIGFMQITGMIFLFNFQFWLLLTGIMVFCGVVLITISLAYTRQFVPVNSLNHTTEPDIRKTETSNVLVPK